MKKHKKQQARQLRQRGWSVRSITKELGCSKSSVSRWVRDITLTEGQIAKLRNNQDRARAKAANHPNSPKQFWLRKRQAIERNAAGQIPANCSLKTLCIVGSALYWAEGYKAGVNMVNFSNSDPQMIKLMMRFFREVCGVPSSRFRGALHLHPHLDENKARKFWAQASGIPLKQFHKTQFAVSKASKNKRDTLPSGTFRIVIADTSLRSKINGWIKGLEIWANKRAVGAAEAHLTYIQRVVGSNPTPPTIFV